MLDYKTKLQEITQSKMKILPECNLVSTRRSFYDPEFIIKRLIDGKQYGKGRGKSKKEAEQISAKSAIYEMKKESLI